MDTSPLASAARRAAELRGTVMLAERGADHRWCCVCGAVDGSLELRVGEPAPEGPWWRRRPAAEREAWLRDHGFVHRVDAWSLPAPAGATPQICAGILAAALREGLDVPDGAELVEVLVHPGIAGDGPVPGPDAPHADHIRAALIALGRRGRGKLHVSGGAPAENWAWVFITEGEMSIEVDLPSPGQEEGESWTTVLGDAEAAAGADRLTELLYGRYGRDPAVPLFVSFMD